MDISILINNVGVAYVGDFEAIPEDKLQEMTIVNCLPIVMLTKAVISKMLRRKNRSAIVNVSSGIVIGPSP